MAEYIKIGKLVAVHGLKGELLLKHELGKKTSLSGLKTVFLESGKKSFFPFFIETAIAKNEEEIYIKLEGISSKEQAQKMTQKEIWLTDVDFKKFAAKSAPANLLGYMIFTKKEILGEIKEVIEQPHQLLCKILVESKEVLIPLNESFLKKIDHRKKQVEVELPDGLLDIYLG